MLFHKGGGRFGMARYPTQPYKTFALTLEARDPVKVLELKCSSLDSAQRLAVHIARGEPFTLEEVADA